MRYAYANDGTLWDIVNMVQVSGVTMNFVLRSDSKALKPRVIHRQKYTGFGPQNMMYPGSGI